MKDFTLINKIAFFACLAAGIDLGLYGLFHIELIEAILGGLLGRLLYIAVGVAAGYLIYDLYLKDRLKIQFKRNTINK